MNAQAKAMHRALAIFRDYLSDYRYPLNMSPLAQFRKGINSPSYWSGLTLKEELDQPPAMSNVDCIGYLKVARRYGRVSDGI